MTTETVIETAKATFLPCPCLALAPMTLYRNEALVIPKQKQWPSKVYFDKQLIYMSLSISIYLIKTYVSTIKKLMSLNYE